MSKSPTREPWERQPEESAKAFAYFSIYRDLDPLERSIKAVAEKVERSYSTIEKACSRYGWVDRAKAWDAHCDEHKRKKRLKEVEKMNARHADLGLQLQGLGLERIAGRVDKSTGEVKGKIKLEDIDASALVKLLDTGTKIERTAREVPESSIAVKIEDRGDGVSEDRIADAIARLEARLRAEEDPQRARPDESGDGSAGVAMGDARPTGATSPSR
jgi:hypothetical protein